jgi:hypothetical protein
MSSKIPAGNTVKALTCGGKAVLGVDHDMKVAFYVGSDGYGPNHASAPDLIGVRVKDADLSFWGGAILNDDAENSVTAWGPGMVYCSSASSISCQPTASDRYSTAVHFTLRNVPVGATVFTGLSCGGKRGGHWCCAYQNGTVGVSCFGDARGEYTPSASELGGVDFPVHQISASVDYLAVLGGDGQLGVYGGSGEIGNGVSNTNPTGLPSLSMGSTVNPNPSDSEQYVQVSTMNFAVYGLKQDGALHAWGKSYSYSVGGGGTVDMAAAVPFSGSPGSFSQLYGGSAGVYAHYCALKRDGVAACWGADYAGQVSGAPAGAVSVGYSHPPLLTDVNASGLSVGSYSASTEALMNSGSSDDSGYRVSLFLIVLVLGLASL